MNLTPYLRLLWKEYRAIRRFWLALVGLVIILQTVVVVTTHYEKVALPESFLFGLVLIAPALFALGCAGTTFAIEREEGTIDFLRAAPVTPWQIVVCKLLLPILGTLAMYPVLLLITLLFSGGRLPDILSFSWPNALDLWLVAAVEAFVWGIFFSLLTARPLLAICLAAAFGWVVAQNLSEKFVGDLSPFGRMYLRAAGSRLLLALLLLFADIYLGLHWLHGNIGFRRITQALTRRRASVEIGVPEEIDHSGPLFAQPERGGMLASLFWQQRRQSGRTMLILTAIYIFLSLLCLHSDATPRPAVFKNMTIVAAIMGASVFRVDQENRRFRFFVEHNVSPRWVWLSRVVPWTVVLLLASSFIYFVLIFPSHDFHNERTDYQMPQSRDFWSSIEMSNASVGLTYVAISFAAGQWASMFIRSALLAGLASLALAFMLCTWTGFMAFLGVNWLWSIAPIPLLLLWATWLRTPDWIRENNRWSARLKAAAVVGVPAFALLIAVPIYRVYQVPLIPPGFDPAEFVSKITPEATRTAELYRQADNKLDFVYSTSHEVKIMPASSWQLRTDRSLISTEQTWVQRNAAVIDQLLQINQREGCAWNNPVSMNSTIGLINTNLISLMVLSGRQLEAEGKLDEALNRYFAALQMVSHWTEYSLANHTIEIGYLARKIILELTHWAAQKNQTADRVAGALARLKVIDAGILHFDNSLKSEYILLRREILDDQGALNIHYGSSEIAQGHIAAEVEWRRLFPWEKYHQLRQLDRMSALALDNLALVQHRIDHNVAIDDLVPQHWIYFKQNENANILNSWALSYTKLRIEAVINLAEFETTRRATMIILAIEAYRLQHDHLPRALAELEGTYFNEVPLSPYSGMSFIYRRTGINEPENSLEASELRRSYGQTGPIIPGKPCIWCHGANRTALNAPQDDGENAEDNYYYPFATTSDHPSNYTTWSNRFWFPIPEQKK